MAENIIIYCDGACSGNQYDENVGGWGAVIKRGDGVKRIYGGEVNTTNNRMELTACIKSLEDVREDGIAVALYSDSAYLVNCMNQKWYVNWQRNGWRNSKKQPVENQDLWERILTLITAVKVRFHKVKGHAGVELNELADGLANRGMDELADNDSGYAKVL